ncbi:MAG: fibronectin type III domain-containing protein [Eubacterium sp.]
MKKILSVVIVVLLLVISLAFTTTVFATNIPSTTITSVKAKSEAFTIKWKKKTNIAGYQIQYSTNSKFKKGNKTIKIKKAKTVSKKITGLKPSKKYYVRIRTYKIVNKKTYYSSWSKKKNVTTKNCEHCTNNNNHSIKCGNIGMWFGSRREVDTYFSSVCNTWGTKYKNEKITWEEYTKNCPQGYECWSCSYCGKWTGNFVY